MASRRRPSLAAAKATLSAHAARKRARGEHDRPGPKPSGNAREDAIRVRVTRDELAEIERAAGDVPASTFVREAALRASRVRIEVSRDGATRHWVAYRGTEALAMAGIDGDDQIEDRVRRAASEHGIVGAEDATVSIAGHPHPQPDR